MKSVDDASSQSSQEAPLPGTPNAPVSGPMHPPRRNTGRTAPSQADLNGQGVPLNSMNQSPNMPPQGPAPVQNEQLPFNPYQQLPPAPGNLTTTPIDAPHVSLPRQQSFPLANQPYPINDGASVHGIPASNDPSKRASVYSNYQLQQPSNPPSPHVLPQNAPTSMAGPQPIAAPQQGYQPPPQRFMDGLPGHLQGQQQQPPNGMMNQQAGQSQGPPNGQMPPQSQQYGGPQQYNNQQFQNNPQQPPQPHPNQQPGYPGMPMQGGPNQPPNPYPMQFQNPQMQYQNPASQPGQGQKYQAPSSVKENKMGANAKGFLNLIKKKAGGH
ncbi:hypothetical protein BKA69DRAFT_1126808 [Paraphysoderma sedebokerense]|nr:hypothetical protein BKA69DRAFT_1126808 [Paraphysoderma sedebokerense]